MYIVDLSVLLSDVVEQVFTKFDTISVGILPADASLTGVATVTKGGRDSAKGQFVY